MDIKKLKRMDRDEKLRALDNGEATINEIRISEGLEPIHYAEADMRLTVKRDKEGEKHDIRRVCH